MKTWPVLVSAIAAANVPQVFSRCTDFAEPEKLKHVRCGGLLLDHDAREGVSVDVAPRA